MSIIPSTPQVPNALPAVLLSLENDQSRHQLFRPGQPLTAEGVLPNQLLLVLEGQARLLSKDSNQVATLRKIGPKEVVGLASMLSASPCETVHASTGVRAAVMSDQEVLQQLEQNPEFSQWCFSQLWPAELARLLHPLRDKCAEDLPPLSTQLESILDNSRIVQPTPAEVEAATRDGFRVFGCLINWNKCSTA